MNPVRAIDVIRAHRWKCRTMMVAALCICWTWNVAQHRIEVASGTVQVPAEGKDFYYGFAAGDTIVLSVATQKQTALDRVEVSRYPAATAFEEEEVRSLTEERITAEAGGIYRFRLEHGSGQSIPCSYSIHRIPRQGASVRFNPSVVWRYVYDTTYTETLDGASTTPALKPVVHTTMIPVLFQPIADNE